MLRDEPATHGNDHRLSAAGRPRQHTRSMLSPRHRADLTWSAAFFTSSIRAPGDGPTDGCVEMSDDRSVVHRSLRHSTRSSSPHDEHGRPPSPSRVISVAVDSLNSLSRRSAVNGNSGLDHACDRSTLVIVRRHPAAHCLV